MIKPNHLSQRRLREIWAQVPPDYYDQGIKKNILQKLWHTQKSKQVLTLLPKDAKRVLDVGCSSAIITAAVAKTLPKSSITGLDSYKAAIDFARKKYKNITFVVADAHNLPFRDKTFDLVICTETLEHVSDPKKSLLEMKRVLSKNGRAIISMDSGSLLFRIIWFLWTKTRGKVWKNAHLHELNAQILENLIRLSGFKIAKKNISHLGMAVTFLVYPAKSGFAGRSGATPHHQTPKAPGAPRSTPAAHR